ncbi:ComEC/Rec2 family competence protein [Candidatus Saccharibacteria bacterium]|nr:ComEC/Rec2 family competence protein [Candidatus Saccharibacteria bacterium]
MAGILLIFFRSAPDFMGADFFQNLIDKEVTISGKVIKDPDDSDGKLNLTLTSLRLSSSSQDNIELNGSLFTQVSGVDIQRSDIVTISGTLSEGFGSYSAAIFRPELARVDRPEPGDLFLKFRDFFSSGVKNYLPSKQSGLALGYLLGQKTGVDDSFKNALRTVGLTHIIVASGAHLGVLIGVARRLFGKISRFFSLLSSIIFTLLFVGVTGLSASMLRASLVVGLSLLAWYYGRKVRPERLILLVAAIALIVNPAYLTDLAWLLSFASFSGILIVAPILTHFFYGNHKKPGFLSSTLISSISATLLCAPILLYFFGSISLISIFANILILPTISIAMGLTFLTGAFAIFIPFLATIVSRVTLIVLNYQISVVEFFSDKKVFLVELPAGNPLVFLLLLPTIIVVILAFIIQKKRSSSYLSKKT